MADMLPFRIKEKSRTSVSGAGYSGRHREISDAFEGAVNHLATQPVGTKMIIKHEIELERGAESEPSFPLEIVNIEFTDANGDLISELNINSGIVIQSEILSLSTSSITFTVIIEIKDDQGILRDVNWISDLSLAAGASAKPGIAWTPSEVGNYTAEVSCWESPARNTELAQKKTRTFTVTQP